MSLPTTDALAPEDTHTPFCAIWSIAPAPTIVFPDTVPTEPAPRSRTLRRPARRRLRCGRTAGEPRRARRRRALQAAERDRPAPRRRPDQGRRLPVRRRAEGRVRGRARAEDVVRLGQGD